MSKLFASLQAKIAAMLVLMLLVSLVLAGLLVRGAWNDRAIATRYDIANRLAGHLNAAAGWQAIERGVGATIVGSKGSAPAAMLTKFKALQEKGDAEVGLAQETVAELLAFVADEDVRAQAARWKETHEALG